MHADTATPIYFDHNATTPLLPEVVDAMLPYLRSEFGNPSSSHAWGLRAREAVEKARSQVADLLGCGADDIYLTSGGTEANNLAIRGVADAAPRGKHRLWTLLKRAIPGVRATADTTERLPNTLSVRFPYVHGSDLLSATPEVAASTGSACHAGHETAFAVLVSMGINPADPRRRGGDRRAGHGC